MPIIVLFHTMIQNDSGETVATGTTFIRAEYDEQSRGRSRQFNIGVEIVDGDIVGNMTAQVSGEHGRETAVMNQPNPLSNWFTEFVKDWASQYDYEIKTSGFSCGIVTEDSLP